MEIEFAARFAENDAEPSQFGFLQIRPWRCRARRKKSAWTRSIPRSLICDSAKVLGHGRISVRDIVAVDFHRFEREQSREVAQKWRR